VAAISEQSWAGGGRVDRAMWLVIGAVWP